MSDLSNEEREALKKEFGFTDAQLDAELEKLNVDDVNSQDSIPTAYSRDDILKFLRDVFNIKAEENLKINRTGNLNSEELGNLTLSVRGYNDIANYADTENYTDVSSYLRGKSNNIITTSTSKKGFFLQLITTTKKISKNIGSKRVSKQSSLFGGTKEVVEGGDDSE